MQRVSEKLTKVFQKYGVGTFNKPLHTIWQHFQWRIQGRFPACPPPLIFRANWGPKGLKKIFWDRAQPLALSQGLEARPPPQAPPPPFIWRSRSATDLVHLKDPRPRGNENVEVQCEGCDDFYIGETASPFGMRFKEHVAITRASTRAVGDHLKLSGRQTFDMSSFAILAREGDTFKRRVREAIEIFCRAPTLSRDANCEFPATYRDVLSRDSQCKSHDITPKSISW